MGNSHPSLFPYEPLPCADGDLIITAGNNGQFRKLVEVLGVPGARRRPALRPQRGPHGQPRRAAAAAGRAAARPAPRRSGSRDIIAAGVPCGPINTIDGGVAFAEEIGLDPVVAVGQGDAAVPSVRNPIRFSATPADYRLPPPVAGRARRGDPPWLAAPAERETDEEPVA